LLLTTALALASPVAALAGTDPPPANAGQAVQAGAPPNDDNGTRIVDGAPAQRGELPWMVELAYYHPGTSSSPSWYAHECGAALIAPQWLLTAAHCVTGPTSPGAIAWKLSPTKGADRGPTHAIAGSVVQGDTTAAAWRSALAFDARHVFVPKTYTPVTDHAFAHDDVALIHLTRAAPHDRPVIHPVFDLDRSKYPQTDGSVRLSGWGATSEQTKAQGIVSPDLRVADLQLLAPQDCETQTLGRYPAAQGSSFPRSVICAGPRTGALATTVARGATEAGKHADACRGDSGGPLVRQLSGAYIVTGVASFELVCGGGAALYTNVAEFSGWIEDTIKANGGPGAPAIGLGRRRQ